MTLQKNAQWVILSFSLVFGWIMSLPYEGPVMYVLLAEKGIDGFQMNSITVFCHFAGLLSGQFLSRTMVQAKRFVLMAIGATLLLSVGLPWISKSLWVLIIPAVSYLTGCVVSSSAHFLKGAIPIEERSQTVVKLLIYGNVVLVVSAVLAINLHAMISFLVIQAALVVSLYATYRIDTTKERMMPLMPSGQRSVFQTFWILFVFIFVITINSGIMFQVIYPYFASFELLTSLYTNLPYILAIYLLYRYLKHNKFFILYVGLALWGLTFILFAFVPATEWGFVIICSLMLFAAGIFDLFWWSIMAANLDHVKNPASLFGLGLSLNVLGVWVGGWIGNTMLSLGFNNQELSYFGLFVVMVSMLIILPLNQKLSNDIESNEFLVQMSFVSPHELDFFFEEVRRVLSPREFEVFNHLIEGKSDQEICKALYLSPHTIKSHNRNIYKKLDVPNRVALIDRIKAMNQMP